MLRKNVVIFTVDHQPNHNLYQLSVSITMQNNPRLKFDVTFTSNILHMNIDDADFERGTVSSGVGRVFVQIRL